MLIPCLGILRLIDWMNENGYDEDCYNFYDINNLRPTDAVLRQYFKKFNPNVGDKISKEVFIDNEKRKNRPYPKKIDIAVPANLKCGKV